MKILDALKNKFSVSGSNIAEVIDKIPNDIPAIPDDIEDGAVPTYDATEEKVDWKVPQGGGGEDLAVSADMLWSDELDTYEIVSHDKNFQDIDAAYNLGKKITLTMNDIDETYPCTYILALSAKDMNPNPEIGTSYLFVGHYSAENTLSVSVSHPVEGEETWYYQAYSPNN